MSKILDEVQRKLSKHEKNKFANELINDEDNFKITLKTPTEESIIGGDPSLTLIFSDETKYDQIVSSIMDDHKNNILQTDTYQSNEQTFDSLASIAKSKACIIPFIGAGFSVSARCPTWSEYIISQTDSAGFDRTIIHEQLSLGKHEEVINDLINKIGSDIFEKNFKNSFENKRITPTESPSAILAEIFNGAYITTNFDRVLENCHQSIQRPFLEKVFGRENPKRYMRAAFEGEKYLLKLHGNIDDKTNRVLSKSEYDSAYSTNSDLTKILTRIFSGFSMIFLGCSLIGDRYLHIMKEMHANAGELIPRHFAIIDAPDDKSELTNRDRFLAERGIHPIWYGRGDWDKPRELLELLKFECSL